MSDELVTPIAGALLDCLGETLEQCGTPVCRVCLEIGQTVIADHCSCTCARGQEKSGHGEAWVRVAQFGPGGAGVSNVASASCSPAAWVIRVDLGVRRCVATPDQNGQINCAARTKDGLQILDDAAAMRRAITNCPDLKDLQKRIVSWAPTAVLGGCAGGVLTVEITVPSGPRRYR